MIIEDDEILRQLYKTCLEKLGYRVTEYENGRVAKDEIKDFIPDACVIDYMMPEMDGISFLKWFKSCEKYKKIPVILLTALYEGDVEEYRDEGLVDVVLRKPASVKKILSFLTEFIEI